MPLMRHCLISTTSLTTDQTGLPLPNDLEKNIITENVHTQNNVFQQENNLTKSTVRQISKPAVKGLSNNFHTRCFSGKGCGHRRIHGVQGVTPPKFLAYLVILCFDKRYLRQNTVARLKSSILDLPKTFWAGYAIGCEGGNPRWPRNTSFFSKTLAPNLGITLDQKSHFQRPHSENEKRSLISSCLDKAPRGSGLWMLI